jgi:endoglucanase
VVGAGSSFPKCMQHQVANLAGSLDGVTHPGKSLLYGATVDGPSVIANFNGLGVPDGANKCPNPSGDPYNQFTGMGVRYYDNVVAWPSVEPADDYTVNSLFAFARAYTL